MGTGTSWKSFAEFGWKSFAEFGFGARETQFTTVQRQTTPRIIIARKKKVSWAVEYQNDGLSWISPQVKPQPARADSMSRGVWETSPLMARARAENQSRRNLCLGNTKKLKHI
jgi:hypothetical protein